jgi:hypothetical protein
LDKINPFDRIHVIQINGYHFRSSICCDLRPAAWGGSEIGDCFVST